MKVVYNNQIIENHKLYKKCGSTLGDVSNKDYPNKNFFNKEIKCFDVDKYEDDLASKQKRNKLPTVDGVIGIRDAKNDNLKSNRLYLLELRMNYKNTDNLDFDNMKKKTEHTRSFFKDDNVENEVAFIFSDAVFQRARNNFERRKKADKRYNYFQPYSVSLFKSFIDTEK